MRSPRGLTRRQALQAGGAGAAALGLAACGDEPFKPKTTHDPDAPNALLLFTDSTRADYIGAYNRDGRNHTPNLDALAKDSLRFSLSVPEAMPTGPARRALLTGVRTFPSRAWPGPQPPLPLGPGWYPPADYEPLLTEVLGEAGIETAYCTDNPFLVGPRYANFRRSLDYARPSYSQASYRFLNKPYRHPAPRSAIERYLLPELSDSVEVGRLRSLVGWDSVNRHRERDYAAARVIRSGMSILDNLKRRGPFFLGVDCFDPHEAFEPPKIFMDRFGPAKGVAAEHGIVPIQPFETPYSWVIRVDLDDDTIERVRELYAAEITFVDAWIGRLMNRLADLDLLDNTVIYYMSDHGIMLGEHGIIGKDPARAMSEIYQVPCMIRDPQGRRAGETSDYFASTHDVARTLLSYMGIEAPGMMNGEDLTVLFEGKEPPARRFFTSMYERYVLAGDETWFMIADSKGATKRLFDKRSDPHQLKDVAADHPAVVHRLWRTLEDEAGGTLPQFSGAGVIGG